MAIKDGKPPASGEDWKNGGRSSVLFPRTFITDEAKSVRAALNTARATTEAQEGFATTMRETEARRLDHTAIDHMKKIAETEQEEFDFPTGEQFFAVARAECAKFLLPRRLRSTQAPVFTVAVQ